jgi:hypothetical protein
MEALFYHSALLIKVSILSVSTEKTKTPASEGKEPIPSKICIDNTKKS